MNHETSNHFGLAQAVNGHPGMHRTRDVYTWRLGDQWPLVMTNIAKMAR